MKDKNAVAMGRKGGKSRWKNIPPEERSRLMKKVAKAKKYKRPTSIQGIYAKR